MDYKIIYTKLINELKFNFLKDTGLSFKNGIDRISFIRDNYNYTEKLKIELMFDDTIWNKDMFNGRINNLEDAICNNNKDDYYRLDKYINIVNRYKISVLDNRV